MLTSHNLCGSGCSRITKGAVCCKPTTKGFHRKPSMKGWDRGRWGRGKENAFELE
jgi:hypothetical protein